MRVVVVREGGWGRKGMEKAERCEQALHVYGPPFRDGKEKEREKGRSGRGMGVVVECTAGCLGTGGGGKGEDASNTMYRETSRLFSRDDQDEEDGVRMDEMEAKVGDAGVADPGAGNAGCSYSDQHEGEGSRQSVIALHPLEIKDGSPVATAKASTSDHSDGIVDVVVQGSPPQLHRTRSVSQPSSVRLGEWITFATTLILYSGVVSIEGEVGCYGGKEGCHGMEMPSVFVGIQLTCDALHTFVQAKLLKLSPTLEYISALAHLTTFGILGVRKQLPSMLLCLYSIRYRVLWI